MIVPTHEDLLHQLLQLQDRLAQLEGVVSEHMKGEESMIEEVRHELQTARNKFEHLLGVVNTHNEHYAKLVQNYSEQTRISREIRKKLDVLDLIAKALRLGKLDGNG